jgi:hypothetical protein
MLVGRSGVFSELVCHLNTDRAASLSLRHLPLGTRLSPTIDKSSCALSRTASGEIAADSDSASRAALERLSAGVYPLCFV